MSITKPMANLIMTSQDNGVITQLYPAGQQRMIVQGLADRGLAERAADGRIWLTIEGMKVRNRLFGDEIKEAP